MKTITIPAKEKKYLSLIVIPKTLSEYWVFSPESGQVHKVEESDDFGWCDCKDHYWRNEVKNNPSHICIHRKKVIEFKVISQAVTALENQEN